MLRVKNRNGDDVVEIFGRKRRREKESETFTLDVQTLALILEMRSLSSTLDS